MSKLLDKLVLPILVPVCVAIVIAYFVNGTTRPGKLILENVEVSNDGNLMGDLLGYWYINQITEVDYYKLKSAYPNFIALDEKYEKNGDSEAQNKLWNEWGSLTGFSYEDQDGSALDNIQGNCDDFSQSPVFTKRNSFVGLVSLMTNYDHLSADIKPNDLKIGAYSLDWKFYSQWPFTKNIAFDSFGLEEIHKKSGWSPPIESCRDYVIFLYYLLVGEINYPIDTDLKTGISTPTLDILIRNNGGKPISILKVRSEVVRMFDYPAGAGGVEITPSSELVLDLNLPNPEQRLDPPISLDPPDTTRIKVDIDATKVYLGDGGGVIFFDLWIDYFNGDKLDSLFLGRFTIEIHSGYWFG